MTIRYALIIALCLSAAVSAQDNAPVTTSTTQESLAPSSQSARQTIQARLAALKAIALKAAKKLPEGETKVLRAVVMETAGKVQWRKNAESAWKKAAKDDVLEPDSMIRTGLRSFMMLRVGLNANILIDSGSRVTLPQMVHAGDTLRTTVQVERGRTDVQVGHVGLTNDFSVLTPSGALAVRGTGMAVSHSALKGTQIFGARTNAMGAIAMKYYGSKVSHVMSGDAISTQKSPDPAAAEAFETAGPAPLLATESQDRQDAPDQTTQAVSGGDAVNQSVRVLLADQQQAINDEIIDEEFGNPFLQDGFSWYVGENGVVRSEDMGAVATALYWDMKLQYVPPHVDPYHSGGHRVASRFEHGLFAATGWVDPQRSEYIHGTPEQGYSLWIPFGTELPTGEGALATTYQSIIDYGDANWSGSPFTTDVELGTMLTIVDGFCVSTFGGDGDHIVVCRKAFADAMNETLYNDYFGIPSLTHYGRGLQQMHQISYGGQPGMPGEQDHVH
jgi:hypothetical protein